MRLLSIALAALAACALSACRTAPSDVEAVNEAAYRVLETGTYAEAASAEAGTNREASVLVASSDEEYRELWRNQISAGSAPPAVDFSRESVVFLLLGQRSSGGWSVEPKGVAVKGDEVEVVAPVSKPEPGGVVTMAFSAPFAVIAVERPGLADATWIGSGGDRVARSGEDRER